MLLNTPNKLTFLRVFFVPLFLAALIIQFPFHYFAALLLFAAASFTDYLDGYLARKNNMVTNFGKFLDPIADKVLTTAAFLGFIYLGIGHGIVWITLIVLFREFAVASLRMLAAANKNVIAADRWGKVKTVVQMVAIMATVFLQGILAILSQYATEYYDMLYLPFVIIMDVLLWLSALLTVISGVNYVVKNYKTISVD